MSRWLETPRLLGLAFLVVIATSLVGGLFGTAAGSGTISDILQNIAAHQTMAHISILGGLANSTGIVILAVLLYLVLQQVNKAIALVALGLWLAEAVFFAVMQLGVLSLIPLSVEYVQVGMPANSMYQTLGAFLYTGLYQNGLAVHMWFYCVGGILWYSLFYKSRMVPRVIPLFGLLTVLVGVVGIAAQLFGEVVPIFVYLPIGLFELIIGFWLLLRGTPHVTREVQI